MKKYILLITLIAMGLFTFVSCDKTPAQFTTTNTFTTNTITPIQISKALEDNGVFTDNAQFPDAIYSLPSEDWVVNTFARSYASFLFNMKSAKYVSEENDCDKFAVFAYAFAHILHHNTPNKLTKTGLTFGEYWYMQDTGGGHAINIAVVKDHGTNKVIFFEPQTQKQVQLSDMEKSFVKFVRF